MLASSPAIPASQEIPVTRISREGSTLHLDSITLEEPLEIQLEYGPASARVQRSVSVTMRTPGYDEELAIGFLYTEGVLIGELDAGSLQVSNNQPTEVHCGSGSSLSPAGIVRISVPDNIAIRTGSLERNFYTSSSCGVCGKASLLALRSVAPPRYSNNFRVSRDILFALTSAMRAAQETFHATGSLHAAALFDADGHLQLLREDVGRHNALDKLVGASLLADELPLRQRILLLSGRASFELLQKAVMAGIPVVVAIGAPSSLAVQIARDFDVTLIGFLRHDHFNIYHGATRIFAE